ncbi:hypothetical protein [Clostridium fungisolvens]|uniref:Uncharacterized protein n=1 Tax=Clostridium fungisolvens TaxID=1604897 RepID=A0A6V8SCK9_9CLOT|nr:hypothetical protein [Clostridium fungisolvens]GFP74436.1 hypothetical protein bsdtw1_00486 [Clostridium fungisolvens]
MANKTNKTDNANVNLENTFSGSKHQNGSFSVNEQSKFSNKYKNVEPLPESDRPRRDGPGGEDGE